MCIEKYKEILMGDLLQAQGCTEPAALAIAGAKTREILGELPLKIDVFCSGNIIKNVKSVVIPNSGEKKGLEVALILGIIGGNSEKELRILEDIGSLHIELMEKYLNEDRIHIYHEKNVENLYIRVEAQTDKHKSVVEIKNHHTEFGRIELDGKQLYSNYISNIEPEYEKFLKSITPQDILKYANTMSIMDDDNSELRELLFRQAEYNEKIGMEGIRKNYGAGIGKMIQQRNVLKDPFQEGVALAAGGSDARMSGCKMPVVINSGSGNQGLTIACPIYTYWKSSGFEEEKLYRALLLSNLLAIYEKVYIGKLSAYCGAMSAAAATGAGIAYLMGMNEQEILQVSKNVLAIGSGMICDGAKTSCAAKIAASLNCVQIAIGMVKNKRTFEKGEGIVADNLDKTICNVGIIARSGMQITDEKILEIMLHK